MKPTTQQQEYLRDYLRKNLRYCETYTEFYDHILSALETKPDTMDFHDAVENIIADDFGGYDGMSGIETRYQKTIMHEMQRRYLDYIVDYLKFPLIMLIASLSIMFYWITQQAWFNFSTFILLLFAIRMIPSILKWVRYLWLGYIFKSIKRSAKDGAFKWLDFVPVLICMMVFIVPALNTASPADWFKNASPFTITLCMLLFALHTLTYFRVYKDEFKTSIAKR